eukprot:scaffold99334_cov56-Attheya_sp.AAC.5
MNNGFSEFQREEDFENNQQVAPSYSAHGPAAIPFVSLNKNQKRKYPSWDKSFKKLVDFKKINGHTNVPQQFGPLGVWVSTQRTHCRLLKEGKYSTLTIDRREKLESIGFAFIRQPPDTALNWDQQFQDLVDFKKIYGHTNVLIRYGPLGLWGSRQRVQHRLLKEGKKSSLTSDRCEKLENIGFEFKCRRSSEYSSWDQRFRELLDFKKINGHPNVPRSFGPLGLWGSHQQVQYYLLKEGKKSSLTSDRCEKLENIGFEFKCRRSSEYSSWDQRFQELLDFKKINGHPNVPRSFGPLGLWGSHQRVQHRLLKEGKKSSLTSDRCEKLENIGFEFKCWYTNEYSTWDQRFQELLDFKKINGYTNVPRTFGRLGQWVCYQRKKYRILKEGKAKGGRHLPLTSDECKKLENIGFAFVSPPTSAHWDQHWDQRFRELQDFKKINGHTNVPKKSEPLWSWVNYQRTKYRTSKERKLKGGIDSSFTSNEFKKLENIGFAFVSPRASTYARGDHHWDHRFRELQDFKKINGHTNVPSKIKPLGRWVRTQRGAFRLFKAGKPSPLTSARREKLESIGFSFIVRYW